MRPSPARTGFTAWVEDLAREQTEGVAAAAIEDGLSGDDAVDAIREAFVTLVAIPQARTLAEHREDTATLLAVLVRCAGRSARRRHARLKPATVPDQRLLDAPSVATLIAAADHHIAARGCAFKVAEIQRHVVVLRVFDELAGSDAATKLGISDASIGVLLHRAKEALQVCMTE
ncbi:MAG: sigma factor-like helix-turn-helix DNA-binding protein [Kofleriaceae bacterium]